MHFNGLPFSSVLEQFSFTSKFFGLKIRKSTFFKEKMVLRVVFIKLTFRWLQTGLPDLKKHQTIEILPMVAFLRIFKMLHFFKIFRDF